MWPALQQAGRNIRSVSAASSQIPVLDSSLARPHWRSWSAEVTHLAASFCFWVVDAAKSLLHPVTAAQSGAAAITTVAFPSSANVTSVFCDNRRAPMEFVVHANERRLRCLLYVENFARREHTRR